MGNGFDFSVERLVGTGFGGKSVPASESGRYRSASERTASEGGPYKMPTREEGADLKIDHYKSPTAGTFYLETFGCQMNEHDSEKVAGVLLARGYKQVERTDEASVILYNTCSIREKAAQKVFSRLGEYRTTRKEGQVIGVLGCVAQQEGEDIFERAPWVSLVCGSASYRKLPELLAQLEAGGKRITGLDLDTDETFETEITRRDNPWRAYLTIIEGCDKACSYCVVPYTRGPERSRASASVLEEVRQLADMGYTEVQLLGPDCEFLRGSERAAHAIFRVAGGGGGSAGDTAGAVHDFTSARFRKRYCGSD